MKKLKPILVATLVCIGNLSLAQSLPVPAHILIVMDENHAYEEIMGDSSAYAPYINSFTTDTDAAVFTQSYALTHPSQPNYLMLFSGDDQGVTSDDISSTQFTTCNLGASLLANGLSFIGYSEDLPSVGYLGTTSGLYARKHNPWSNWQGSSGNAIPQSSNVPYTLFPSNFDSLPTVSFVMPDLDDDMHSASIAAGDTWLKNNLDSYITWAKSHNSLFILTFDEDDDNHNNNIPTIFVGQMVKGGSYSDTITHYNVLRTIEEMYGLADCANSDSVKPITFCWKTTTTGINQISINNNQLSIYPNPTNGIITITSTKNSNEIKVTNLLGQVVFASPHTNTNSNLTGDLGVTRKTIDLSNLQAGIYFVTVISDNETTTGKIVVSR